MSAAGKNRIATGAAARELLGRSVGRRFSRAWSRADGWSAAVAVLFLAGVAVRWAAIFPVTRFPADADCIQTGLCALKILAGDLRVFYNGVRIGALESYLHALAFLALGSSRRAMGIAPFLSSTATMWVWWRLLGRLAGRRAACFGLAFIALPSPAFLFWTAQPNGYAEILLLCAATLWLAVEVARKPERPGLLLAFGLAAGLAWWASVQTICCTLPALLWLAAQPRLRRLGLALSSRGLALAALGFALGAAPWIYFNVRFPLASFSSLNSVSRPAPGLAPVAGNLRFVATYSLPELALSLDPEGGSNPPGRLARALFWPAGAIYLAAVVFFATALFPAGRNWHRAPGEDSPDALSGRPPSPRSAVWLAVLVVAVTAAVNVFSAAGSTRGLIVRYVLPVYLFAPFALGLLLAAVFGRKRWLAPALALPILLFDASVYFWPWTPMRRRLAVAEAGERSAFADLTRQGVEAVVGEYWLVYPLNFLSRERIAGIPCLAAADLYGTRAALARPPRRWALLDYSGEAVTARMAAAGIPGRLHFYPPSYALFLPRSLDTGLPLPERTPEAFLARLCPPAP